MKGAAVAECSARGAISAGLPLLVLSFLDVLCTTLFPFGSDKRDFVDVGSQGSQGGISVREL